MLRLFERYANFVSRLAVSIAPVEPLSNLIAGLLFAPLALLCVVVVFFPLGVAIKLLKQLLEAMWPSQLWAQISFGTGLFVVGVVLLVFLAKDSERGGKQR